MPNDVAEQRRLSRPSRLSLAVAVSCLLATMPCAAEENPDYARVIAAPEALAYAATVADTLTAHGRRKFPELQHSTSEGAIRTFCSRYGDPPDLLLIPIRGPNPNIGTCNVAELILQLPIGRQVLVVYSAPGQPSFALTTHHLFRAIIRDVPDPRTKGDAIASAFIPNPAKNWSDSDPALPAIPIRLLMPPRRALQWLTIEALVMWPACLADPLIATLRRVDEQAVGRRCLSRRADGVLQFADGDAYAANHTLLPANGQLAVNERGSSRQVAPASLASIGGVTPDDTTVTNGTYPLTMTVIAAVKAGRMDVVPNLRNFLIEMTSDKAAGIDGYLSKIGLDPLSAAEMRRGQTAARYSTAD